MVQRLLRPPAVNLSGAMVSADSPKAAACNFPETHRRIKALTLTDISKWQGLKPRIP